ncbi:hypothetical protein [Mucilaginibacter straminoryzae]
MPERYKNPGKLVILHSQISPGLHTLKIYMIDPEVVLERIVVNPNDKYPSYLGAPSIMHQ